MWVFTKYGMVSAVKKGERIAVRARRKEHLQKLLKFAKVPAQIQTPPNSDYRYRAFLDQEEWAEVLSLLALGIEYPNFKDAVEDTGQPEYSDCLHRVWAEVRKIQK